MCLCNHGSSYNVETEFLDLLMHEAHNQHDCRSASRVIDSASRVTSNLAQRGPNKVYVPSETPV